MKWFVNDKTIWMAVLVGLACGCATLPLGRPPRNGILTLIPRGDFLMGNADTNYVSVCANEFPVHRVWISAFYMDRTEVTKALWDEVRAWAVTNGYADLPAGETGFTTNAPTTPEHPVTQVNWYAAVKWCNARSEKERLAPVYYTAGDQSLVYRTAELNLSNGCVRWSARGYRLPTEAEWEKAARGGLEGQFYPWPGRDGRCEDHMSPARTRYKGGPADTGTAPVGYFNGSQMPEGPDMANGYGLYDMAGNVWEWCWDYGGDSYYAYSPARDPRGPETVPYYMRILRGGSWRDGDAVDLRCARRNPYDPGTSNPYTGFRCVRRP